MAGIPAKVAGVPERILITPRPSDVVLAAAAVADVTRVLAIGGAQGIAAVAFGTASVPRVDKIVGPGNAWVTAAKRLVYGTVDIDGIAGPSEILVVADASADPALVAADLLSQAEHDELASAVWVTDHPPLVPLVDDALREQLATLPRRDIAARSLRAHGAAVLCDSRAAMLREADAYAPEHLELLVEEPDAAAQLIRRAGAIFVGVWTPEAAGDYTAGPSHVLPTAGAARFASPLGVWDFVRWSSVIRLDREALARQAPAILALARAEGLEAHARAVELRLRERGDAAEHGAARSEGSEP
jgi:histidinol dehydrogenase